MALIHREQWVDLIKIFACVLVALGHFFQGMIPSGIYPSTGFFRWFEQTIYYFHVPLFLICSGYLFQHNSRIDSPQAWLQNIKHKLLSLGIPYITFSFATWILKVLFSDSVNSQAGNLLETLFLAPVGQMWYLYCLIFIFFCTITLNSKKIAILYLAASIILKISASFGVVPPVFAASTVMHHLFWFVLGMLMARTKAITHLRKAKYRNYALICLILFLVISIPLYLFGITQELVSWAMGIIACFGFIVLFVHFQLPSKCQAVSTMLKYTFPVYVMHTIFAAGVRGILIKFGCMDATIHTIIGITSSFIGPVIVAIILDKIPYFNFLLYPTKYIKVKKPHLDVSPAPPCS